MLKFVHFLLPSLSLAFSLTSFSSFFFLINKHQINKSPDFLSLSREEGGRERSHTMSEGLFFSIMLNLTKKYFWGGKKQSSEPANSLNLKTRARLFKPPALIPKRACSTSVYTLEYVSPFPSLNKPVSFCELNRVHPSKTAGL